MTEPTNQLNPVDTLLAEIEDIKSLSNLSLRLGEMPLPEMKTLKGSEAMEGVREALAQITTLISQSITNL